MDLEKNLCYYLFVIRCVLKEIAFPVQDGRLIDVNWQGLGATSFRWFFTGVQVLPSMVAPYCKEED